MARTGGEGGRKGVVPRASAACAGRKCSTRCAVCPFEWGVRPVDAFHCTGSVTVTAVPNAPYLVFIPRGFLHHVIPLTRGSRYVAKASVHGCEEGSGVSMLLPPVRVEDPFVERRLD